MLLVFAILLGLAAGSFLSALTHRVTSGQSVLWDRSRCPTCHHVLGVRDLVPLLSFFASRGRCRYCGTRIPLSYPLLELTTASLFIAFAFKDDVSPLLAFHLIVVMFLTAIFVVDIRTSLIPDILSFPLIGLGLVGNLLLRPDLSLAGPLLTRELGFLHLPLLSIFSSSQTLVGIPLALLALLVAGILAGSGFFLVQILLSRGRWVGGGDVRLGAAMGAILGLEGLLVALGIAYFVGAVVGGMLILVRRTHVGGHIPFGPFLVGGLLLTLLYGQEILLAYLRFIGFSV